MIGLVVIAVVAGALVAHSLYHQQPVTTGLGSPPAHSSVPSADEPGPSTITFAQDFANYPQHGELLNVLQSYFDAINDKQYDEWVAAVSPALAAEQTPADFLKGYHTTRDGSIYVYRVDTAPANGARVLLSFTSTQALADAPANFPHECIRWQVVLPLAWDGKNKKYEVDAGITGSSPQKQVC